MAANPIFVGSVRTETAQIATANANRDGSGTVGTVFTAGASGSKIVTITIKAQVTTTAGMIRLFLYDGANYYLWNEVIVTAIVVAASTQSFYASISPDLILESGWSLRASTQNAETFNVIAQGGDY